MRCVPSPNFEINQYHQKEGITPLVAIINSFIVNVSLHEQGGLVLILGAHIHWLSYLAIPQVCIISLFF